MAPASTGRDSNNNTAVIKMAQQNKGILWYAIPWVLIFIIVVIKLIAPNKEETPARCRENIIKSTAPPEWDWIEDKGGYQNL